MWIFDHREVGTPNPYVSQGSALIISLLRFSALQNYFTFDLPKNSVKNV